jgi:hypothetical protein
MFFETSATTWKTPRQIIFFASHVMTTLNIFEYYGDKTLLTQ